MATIPIVLRTGRKSKNIISTEALIGQADGTRMEVLEDAFKNSVYWRSFVGFFTQDTPETAASLVMTTYGIPTMIGAMATGFPLIKFRMKNVLGSVYGTRVLISLFILLFPKGFVSAIVIMGSLGITGSSAVPPMAGLVTEQFGAFFSLWSGRCCFTTYGNYTLPRVVNTVLCLITSVASFSIKEETTRDSILGQSRRNQLTSNSASCWLPFYGAPQRDCNDQTLS